MKNEQNYKHLRLHLPLLQKSMHVDPLQHGLLEPRVHPIPSLVHCWLCLNLLNSFWIELVFAETLVTHRITIRKAKKRAAEEIFISRLKFVGWICLSFCFGF